MTTVFNAKVRRLGNSLAVIVPKKIAEEAGAKPGDSIKILLLKSKAKTRSALDEIAGIDSGSPKPFIRDRRERV